MKDYYSILEVPPTATQETIKEQYYFLIQAWHPDKFSNPAHKSRAEEISKDLNTAYNILKNPQKRAEYDRQRTGQPSLSSEVLRRREAKKQQERKQAEEKKRSDDYERQQRERAEEERRRAYFESQKREEAEIEKLRLEFEKARRRLLEQPLAELNNNLKDPIRVLIVDDTLETRGHIRRILGDEVDIKIVGEAANGADAIEQFGVLMPDVITMDINMPVLDGIIATEIICQKHSGAKVIMFTIQGSSTYMRRCLTAGACDYVLQPPINGELGSAIRRAAGRKTSTRV
jgi:curved DNA-binding protein CbpA